MCPEDIQRLNNVPRRCTICIHKKRNEIENVLIENQPFRAIASQFGVSHKSLQRHKKNGHIAKSLIKAHEINKIVNADDLVVKILHLQKETLIVLSEAKEVKDHNTILSAVGKAGQLIKIQAELTGQLQEAKVINVYIQPAFIKMQSIILTELDQYPEVKYKIAEALENASGDGTGT